MASIGSTLALAISAVVAVHATPLRPDPIAQWGGMIADASARFGVPQRWIADVMSAESAGHTMSNGRPIRSRAGAMGLMQLMPATWAELRVANHLGADPDDPRDNILAGAAYLRLLYDRFGYPGLFAAYNAGPTRYGLSIDDGRPLPAETKAYLRTVTGGAAPPRTVAATQGALFFPIATRAAPNDHRPATLFVPLTTVPSGQ